MIKIYLGIQVYLGADKKSKSFASNDDRLRPAWREFFRIKEVVIHPQYKRKDYDLAYDLALVRIDYPAVDAITGTKIHSDL